MLPICTNGTKRSKVKLKNEEFKTLQMHFWENLCHSWRLVFQSHRCVHLQRFIEIIFIMLLHNQTFQALTFLPTKKKNPPLTYITFTPIQTDAYKIKKRTPQECFSASHWNLQFTKFRLVLRTTNTSQNIFYCPLLQNAHTQATNINVTIWNKDCSLISWKLV